MLTQEDLNLLSLRGTHVMNENEKVKPKKLCEQQKDQTIVSKPKK